MSDIDKRLAELQELGLLRTTRLVSGPQGPRVVLDGRPVLLLCSNNYLGLADHPRVREAAADAAMRWGVGSGASRLVSGTMTIHRRLEERLAEFEHTERAVLFGSGYLANVGVVGALAAAAAASAGTPPIIYSDQLNHASIIDGCRLANARTVVYDHADVDHLASLMREHPAHPSIIVTDSVFSMDGDVAPLPQLVRLAREHGARIVVDEAHATGCLGPEGRGVVADFGLEGQIDVVVGTLGKALGSYGAYAACSAEVAALLQNTARPFIFSTALGPPQVAAALAALLTAAVAVSMALTPVAMILYERVAALMDAAIPDVTPDTGAFDEGEPDIIIAGFGRFGQIAGRMLSANGFKSTVLDSDIEQIELLRRFGRRVHYGDATRLDLLRQAGADRARMLIVALDDREKTVELVETARKGQSLTRKVQTGIDPETRKPTFEDEEIDLTPLPFIVVIIFSSSGSSCSCRPKPEPPHGAHPPCIFDPQALCWPFVDSKRA